MINKKVLLWIKQVKAFIVGLDPWIIGAILGLFTINLFVQYSANDRMLGRLISDIIYLVISFAILLVVSNINYRRLKNSAVFLYVVSLILILLVLIIGVKVNGARRWLNLGIRIQPSELCKLSVPLLVATYLSNREKVITALDYLFAFMLILVPFALVAKQPDLGTGILIFSAGFFVLFFAGLPYRVIIISLVLFVCASPLIWHHLHDYQKHRILTLINPQSDPLGAGYHVIQGIIAIGSGGLFGKGYLAGTQAHLNFIPEKHTDFVISVVAEEFGLFGLLVILCLYLIIILRGLSIMRDSTDLFAKTMAGSISLSFMLYVFINMGMVAGIFPVVGVPLPFISYGGTAIIILMVGLGILLSINRSNEYLHSKQD